MQLPELPQIKLPQSAFEVHGGGISSQAPTPFLIPLQRKPEQQLSTPFIILQEVPDIAQHKLADGYVAHALPEAQLHPSLVLSHPPEEVIDEHDDDEAQPQSEGPGQFPDFNLHSPFSQTIPEGQGFVESQVI